MSQCNPSLPLGGKNQVKATAIPREGHSTVIGQSYVHRGLQKVSVAITQHKTRMQQQLGQVVSPGVNPSSLLSLCSASVLWSNEKCDIGGWGEGWRSV